MRNGIIVAIYFVVLAINLMSAIKFPDSTITIYHLLSSIVFLAMLIYVSIKNMMPIKYFLLLATVGSIYVFTMIRLEADLIGDFLILDGLVNLQYPLYILFITPLFGLNYFSQMSIDLVAILIAIVYAVLLLTIYPAHLKSLNKTFIKVGATVLIAVTATIIGWGAQGLAYRLNASYDAISPLGYVAMLTCASFVLFIVTFLVARKARVTHQWKVLIYVVLSVLSICTSFFSIIVLLFWIG
ncbi:MAG: hypothetical protein ACI33M_13460 [Lysinibacillus sp.]